MANSECLVALDKPALKLSFELTKSNAITHKIVECYFPAWHLMHAWLGHR